MRTVFCVHKVKYWWPHFYKNNTTSVEISNGGIRKKYRITFKISTFIHFIYTNGKIKIKSFINRLISFLLKKTNCTPKLPAIQALPAGRILINKRKIDDVKKLCQYVIEHEEILSWPPIFKIIKCQITKKIRESFLS